MGKDIPQIREEVMSRLAEMVELGEQIQSAMGDRPLDRRGMAQLSLKPKSGMYIITSKEGNSLIAEYHDPQGNRYEVQVRKFDS